MKYHKRWIKTEPWGTPQVIELLKFSGKYVVKHDFSERNNIISKNIQMFLNTVSTDFME